MAEFTGIAIQTVAQGEDVAFTETPVCATKCIVHRQGSGIVKLRGLTNQCRARFLVSYSGNIQIPTDVLRTQHPDIHGSGSVRN